MSADVTFAAQDVFVFFVDTGMTMTITRIEN